MIVCSCNVLTDRQIFQALSSAHPPRTAGQAHLCLGCAPCCGRCLPTVARLMREAGVGSCSCADEAYPGDGASPHLLAAE